MKGLKGATVEVVGGHTELELLREIVAALPHCSMCEQLATWIDKAVYEHRCDWHAPDEYRRELQWAHAVRKAGL